GWTVNENKESFKIEDGAIVAEGDRSHCFYTGDFEDGKFEDFELRMDIMTKPSANGGVFIHTDYVEEGWPPAGYEIQVNNTQSDWQKSGGVYNAAPNKEPFEDDTWMKYVIEVKRGRITVHINDKKVAEYKPDRDESRLQKDGGMIALQAHDPGSKSYYKNIRIKPL